MRGYILFARMKVIVIIPAAGLGTRMVSAPAGKDRKAAASKQFLELDGIPVLVHTLRRFAQSPQINEIFGAATTGVPAVDTVKQVERTAEGALIKTTIPRQKVVMAQTPQGFRYDVIKKAFDEATADGFIGTDEASLVERSGHQVAVVMGSPRNIKITTPADLELAKFYSTQIA